MNDQIFVIVQARIGSTRLPGKIFKDIAGKPMLWHVISRLKCSQRINDIIIAIPDSAPNDEIEDFVKGLGIKCFRGNEEDVLSRYYGAAAEYKGKIIVRVTSDCPLIDPRIMDSVIEIQIRDQMDYTSKGPNGSFSRGLDSEVFNFEVLERAYKEANQAYEREHVTPYIYQHPELFKVNIIQAVGRLRRPDLRLTVDTDEDLTLVREIYRRLYRNGHIFYIEDIIDLMDKYPELKSINAGIRQKELRE